MNSQFLDTVENMTFCLPFYLSKQLEDLTLWWEAVVLRPRS